MADAAQEFGLSRAWRRTVNNVGEREVVLALAIFLPLGALLLGYCGGKHSALQVESSGRLTAVWCAVCGLRTARRNVCGTAAREMYNE